MANIYRNEDGTFKKGIKRPDSNKGGRKGFELENKQYERIKEVVDQYLKLAKKLYKGRVKGAKSVKKEDIPELIKKWFKDRSHSSIYIHKNKRGFEYHFNPELEAYLAEKLEIGKKLIDKVHPQKSSEKVTFEVERIEEGFDKIKKAIESEISETDEL